MKQPCAASPTPPCKKSCTSRDDSSPLVDFFRLDLGEEWAAFIESAKDLAGLILDTEASVTDFDMDEDQERLKSLRKPFLSLLAKAQAMVD